MKSDNSLCRLLNSSPYLKTPKSPICLRPHVTHMPIPWSHALSEMWKRGGKERDTKIQTDLLNSGGEIQAELNDFVLGCGKVSYPSKWSPVVRFLKMPFRKEVATQENHCNFSTYSHNFNRCTHA